MKLLRVFRTENGRSNGLIACCVTFFIISFILLGIRPLTASKPFERESVLESLLDLLRSGMRDLDVMQSSTANGAWEHGIWQARQDIFTVRESLVRSNSPV